MRLTQWIEGDSGTFIATGNTRGKLLPGTYDINVFQGTAIFTKLEKRDEELIRFPGSVSDAVVAEIQTFWDREELFRKHELPYKRGILLYGPPGSGKSSTLRLITEDVASRGGVVFTFPGPSTFITCYHTFRTVQPDTPLVVLMEDLDAVLQKYDESKVLNLLDGIEVVNKVAWLATTNYPQRLEARVVNRPSRFDRRFKVPHPTEEWRRMYLASLLRDGDDVDLDQWAKDTGGLSVSHLKELFVATVILGNPYAPTLKALQKMRESVSSLEDEDEFVESHMGFYK